jgi:hypothetical protein
VCLRPVLADDGARALPAAWGSAHPESSATLRRVVTEQRLYTQLCHFHRLLDAEGAAKRAGAGLPAAKAAEARRGAEERLGGLGDALRAAAEAVAALRDRSRYRWVDLGAVFGGGR